MAPPGYVKRGSVKQRGEQASMSRLEDIIFGIDLGTTYSCIAYVDEYGKPVIIPNSDRRLTTPSVVLFEGEQRIVGEEAKSSALLNPDCVVEMVKRHMGEAHWRFFYEDREYTPEEISSYILRKLAADAEATLHVPVRDVIVTCPAYFGITQREATVRAGEIAGFTVYAVINEPTAAAITYGLQDERDQVVLVYDLGGGTFDVTVIEIKGGAITVIATGGDYNLGGRNWDEAIVVYLAQQWQASTGSMEDPTEFPDTLQDCWLKAERAKQTLSTRKQAKLVASHNGRVAKVSLTRNKFNELTAGLLDRTIVFTKMTMQEAVERGYKKFDQILLVGDSTRMPQVAERLEHEFHLPLRFFEPGEAVAKGAAIYGQRLLLSERIQTRIAEMTGVSTAMLAIEEVPPTVKQQAQTDVAGELGFEERAVEKLANASVTNVASHSFGIIVTADEETPWSREVVENLMVVNEPLPCLRVHVFGTLEANQEAVELQIVENTEKAELVELGQDTQEMIIGRVILPLSSRLPAHSPIKVTFKLDQQGRLHVIGHEPQSGAAVETTFETRGGPSQAELRAAKSRMSRLTIL